MSYFTADSQILMNISILNKMILADLLKINRSKINRLREKVSESAVDSLLI